MSNFQPLEVVDRSSETQPQVVENSSRIRVKLAFNHCESMFKRLRIFFLHHSIDMLGYILLINYFILVINPLNNNH